MELKPEYLYRRVMKELLGQPHEIIITDDDVIKEVPQKYDPMKESYKKYYQNAVLTELLGRHLMRGIIKTALKNNDREMLIMAMTALLY